MNKLILLTDGSVNTQSKIGYGAYLSLSDITLPIDSLKKNVRIRRFENTSSTKLELQTLLWALEEIQTLGRKITLYTDSQNIIGLPGRRERFENNNYRSKKNKLLNNHELYREFFKLTDLIDIEFTKVKGHKLSKDKDDIDRLFTLVDRASRDAVRNDNRKLHFLTEFPQSRD